MSVDLKSHFQQYQYTVADVEPVTDFNGNRVQPQRLSFEISDGVFAGMYVYGLVYKKDGTLGTRKSRTCYLVPDIAPEWARKIVADQGVKWSTDDEAASA